MPRVGQKIVQPQTLDCYTDNDLGSVLWCRELVDGGHLPMGDSIHADIAKLSKKHLEKYRRVHLFAGIGGWGLALELAGWPSDVPVWSGSCPCQPFSTAGQQLGESDERHLWPEMFRLIKECRPFYVFGEQVASQLGREWLARVRADLELLGYAVGAADLCAAGVASPHRRQRLFWVADATGSTWKRSVVRNNQGTYDRELGRVANPTGGWVSNKLRERVQFESNNKARTEPAQGSINGYWENYKSVKCTDGNTRRIESGVLPLAHGVPNRVGLLRGFGNAIVPELAAVFIRSFIEAKSGEYDTTAPQKIDLRKFALPKRRLI
jgi:DNA (cytosine-5)-methyltransferase 1